MTQGLNEDRKSTTFRQRNYAPLAILTIVLTIAICIAVLVFWKHISHLQNYGYIGALISGFIAGSSIPMPFPYLVVTFTLGGVLNPLFVGIASGLGAGIGGTLVYLFGRSSSNLARYFISPGNNRANNGRAAKIIDLAYRRGALAVFIMSLMLNPAFGPMAIAMGALRFGFLKFFFWCSVGNIAKSLFIAYCGYFGLGTLLRWLGG